MNVKPAIHPDIASYIGAQLARDTLNPEKRALYLRMYAHMNATQKAHCDLARSWTMVEGGVIWPLAVQS